jgi:hypothetical protein
MTEHVQPSLFDGLCQRWVDGVDCWQHVDGDVFQPHRYQVTPIDETAARDFTTCHHYSRAWPAAQLRYGLIEDGVRLVGTCVLGVPMQAAVLTIPFPTLVPYRESMELSRLVLLDRVPANAESWFVSRVFRDAARQGVRGVVAFSDPVRRIAGGRPVMPGHVGIVYQALGAVYTGRGTARTVTMLPDGAVLTARTIAKITGQEQGHVGAVSRLVNLGAPPKPEQMPGREWLPEALVAVGARKVRHPGNHRYAWTIGPRWIRRGFPVAMPALPYPKPPSLIEVSA